MPATASRFTVEGPYVNRAGSLTVAWGCLPKNGWWCPQVRVFAVTETEAEVWAEAEAFAAERRTAGR